MNTYFLPPCQKVTSLLFGGLFIPSQDMHFPFALFYHLMPYSYSVRSTTYETFAHGVFKTCELGSFSAICIQEESEGSGVPGVPVLEAFQNVMPDIESEDSTIRDILILIGMGAFYKALFTVLVTIKTLRVAHIQKRKDHVSTTKKKDPPVLSDDPHPMDHVYDTFRQLHQDLTDRISLVRDGGRIIIEI